MKKNEGRSEEEEEEEEHAWAQHGEFRVVAMTPDPVHLLSSSSLSQGRSETRGPVNTTACLHGSMETTHQGWSARPHGG